MTLSAVIGSGWFGWPSCDHAHVHDHTSKAQFIKVLERICAAALGIFAFLVEKALFMPFFVTGIGIGLYNYFHDSGSKHNHGSCSLGYLQHISGGHLPEPVCVVGEAVLVGAHIEHLSKFMVPLTALVIGSMVGQATAHYSGALKRYVRQL
jgi:hypothetical protein